MASVQNCSLLQKDSTVEPNGLHARPYRIAPNASCPDMVGWPLVARGSRGSRPGKNLPHRYEKGCNVEKAISDACHAWRFEPIVWSRSGLCQYVDRLLYCGEAW